MDAMVTTRGADHLQHLVIRAPEDATIEEAVQHLPGSAVTVGQPSAGAPLLHGSQLDDVAMTRGDPTLASVVVLSGPDSGRCVDLRPGRWVSIGRDPSCDLTVEDPAMSRVHLRVRHERDRFLLEDLGSTNGIRLEGSGRTGDDDSPPPGAPSGGGDGSAPPGRGRWDPGSTLLVGTTRLTLVSQAPAPLALTRQGARVLVRPWPRHVPQVPDLALVSPTAPVRRAVRAPSVWTWSLPLVLGVGVALVLKMPWLMLFGLLGPAMVFGQYLGDRRSSRLDHQEAVADHERAVTELHRARQHALAAELAVRRELDPGVAGVRSALVPRPSTRLWCSPEGPPRVVIGQGPVRSRVTVDDDPQTLADAPITLTLDHPVAVVGPPVLRDAAVRSWVLQAATTHPPRTWSVVVDLDSPPAGWDLLAWLPHTRTSPPDNGTTRLTWGQDLILVEDVREAPGGIPRVLVTAQDHAVLQRPGQEDLVFVPTLLAHPVARAFARRLAPLTDGTDPLGTGALSAARTLGDLVPWPQDTERCLAGWARPGPELRVPIGIDPAGEPVVVDLATDGPHALVAGTTGSGKSELLRTLVTGLALRNAPDLVTFLLIDYKGGSSLGECDALPHSTGLVTDLDPHLAQRVLTSLQAELHRRESVLATSGARDVGDYDGTDLPRLVIVIDEFRVLREELPAFLDGLIRVAAVGRSLGLHLVLATQRPAGVVTADLRANVNLRIALRLRDESDSRDVIETPGAALLPEGRPGAALIRTGASPPRSVQVVPAGPRARAPGSPPWSVTQVQDPWEGLRALRRREDRTGPPPSTLAMLPTIFTEAAGRRGHRARPVWLPALPAIVDATTVVEAAAVGEAVELGNAAPGTRSATTPGPWALADRPEQQSREALVWDGRHHVAVVGAARTGRSTTLGALTRSAGRCWVYVLDPGRGMERTGIGDHPGLRAWVGPEEVAHGLRVLEVISSLIDQRLAAPSADPDRVVVVLDGWDRWTEQAGDVEAGRGIELALRVLREGPAAGVCALMSGDRSLLLGKLAATVPETWALRFNDPGELTLAGLRRDQIPIDPPPGRAVRLRDGLVAQVVLDASSTSGSRLTGTPASPAPPRIRPLPRTRADEHAWAVGGDEAAPVPPLEGSVVVLGPPRSGVTSTLCRLAGLPFPHDASHDDHGVEDGVVMVAGPGTWTDADLAQVLTGDVHTVVVDEAHLLAGTTTEDLVLDWERRGDGRLLVGGELEACSAQFRGLVHHLSRHRRGIVLQPAAPRDGHVLGMAVPVGDPRVPGRGVLVDRGRAQRIQVTTPA